MSGDPSPETASVTQGPFAGEVKADYKGSEGFWARNKILYNLPLVLQYDLFLLCWWNLRKFRLNILNNCSIGK